MNIKNYTSTVPAMNSAAAIEKLLVEAGASSISKWYEDKQPKGFLFQLAVQDRLLVFRLPSNEELVAKLMLGNTRNPDAKRRLAIRAQAQRTAWRTLHEWVAIQVAMIQLQQVEPLQVFLPYHYNETTGKTFFEEVTTGSLKLLGA